jgi:hypothetical protein
MFKREMCLFVWDENENEGRRETMFQINYVQYQNVAILWVKGISEVLLV